MTDYKLNKRLTLRELEKWVSQPRYIYILTIWYYIQISRIKSDCPHYNTQEELKQNNLKNPQRR